MNNTENSQLIRYVKSQERARYFNALISIVGVAAVIFSSYGFGIQQFFVASLVIFVLNGILNFFTSLYFKIKLINGHYDAVDGTSEPDQNIKQFEIVKTPEKPIGKFMDKNFFDWLELKDQNGKIQRWNFAGTINVSNPTFKIPNGWMLMEPGLLYQVQE